MVLPIKDLTAFTHPKIKTPAQADGLLAEVKKEGKTIGLGVGGFDLLHPGHAKHFESAKQACDFLVIGVTTNPFVSGRKGDGRPLFPAELRAYMIACLEQVDMVILSDHKLAVPFIERFSPDKYIKGPDYKESDDPGIIIEREAIQKAGGEMFYTQDEKLSTSDIIAYIKNL